MGSEANSKGSLLEQVVMAINHDFIYFAKSYLTYNCKISIFSSFVELGLGIGSPGQSV